jgi:hypothetical protein
MKLEDKPDGLLLHENLVWSLLPPHAGMRQYWRDLDSLERWTRSTPHPEWWLNFARDTGGTGFWHEAYFMRGATSRWWSSPWWQRPSSMAVARLQ